MYSRFRAIGVILDGTPEVEQLGWRARRIHYLVYACRDVGILGRDVAVLVDVVRKVVEFERRAVVTYVEAYALPVTHANGLTASQLVEFPIEIRVLILSASSPRRQHRNAVGGDGVAAAYKLGKGGHYIPEGHNLIALGALGYVSRVTYDEWYAYASLVHVALAAAQGSVAVEEVGIGAALTVRAVVRGEDYERIVGYALLLEQRHDLAYVSVQTRHHRRERCHRVLRGAVAAAV